MRYFTLDTIGESVADEYCFSDKTPDGINTRWYRLATGVPFGPDYPARSDEVSLALGEDYPGLTLPSFIGNTARMLIVNTRAAAIIVSHNVGRVEQLPFVLLDHKGRVYSRDYVFLNPLERITCLNLVLSEVRRSSRGDVRQIKRMVIDHAKERDFPDLFRLGEKPNVYLFSETVVSALQRDGCTNFVFNVVESR